MNKKTIWFLIFLCIIYIIGFGIDTMDQDASQYASISREMLSTGHYLHVFDRGKDYLDKPPFLFWISSLSMRVFGINNFAYRFPSFLFALFALFSTYKLCSLYYKKEISILAALVLATCQGFFLMNHDVRTDTILMSWVIFSLWQLAEWYQSDKLLHFVLASIGIAGGMLTKGPIALIVPMAAFGPHFLLQRNYKVFFRWQYLLGIVIIALILLPMSIGLYQQFDLHPEKIVNAQKHVSGLRFYYWTQSFGRITGESTWNNNSDLFFLLQNMLWSFLPWILFLLIGLFLNIRQLVQQKFKLLPGQEWISTGGFIFSYLLLGSSKYQLPHYIFVVFPLAAIVTAKFLYTLLYGQQYPILAKSLKWVHFIIFTLIWALLMLLLSYYFKTNTWIILLAGICCAIFLFLSFYKQTTIPSLLLICLFSISGVNLFLNASVYPSLLSYQMGNVAGRWIHDNNIPTKDLFIYRFYDSPSLDYYAQSIIQHKDSTATINSGDYILMQKDSLGLLTNAGKEYQVLFQHEDFHVSVLTPEFLNPATRDSAGTNYVIVKIK